MLDSVYASACTHGRRDVMATPADSEKACTACDDENECHEPSPENGLNLHDDAVGHSVARSHAEHAISERLAMKDSSADVGEGEGTDDVSSGPELIAGVSQGVEGPRLVREASRTDVLIQKCCAR